MRCSKGGEHTWLTYLKVIGSVCSWPFPGISCGQKALWAASGQVRAEVGHCGLKVYFTGNGAEKPRKEHPGALQTEKKSGSVNTTSKEREFKYGSRASLGSRPLQVTSWNVDAVFFLTVIFKGILTENCTSQKINYQLVQKAASILFPGVWNAQGFREHMASALIHRHIWNQGHGLLWEPGSLQAYRLL